MQLSKQDTQIAKGIAIIGMVMLHLFCRTGTLPYTTLINIGDTPLIYYFGLFGDLCVPVFLFCSGYAHNLIYNKNTKGYIKRIPNKLLRFLLNYWIIVVIFSLLGLFFDKSGTIPGSFKDFLGNFFLVGMNYNGAWWFVLTYIFLLILSPAIVILVKKIPAVLLLIISAAVYFVSYIFRFSYTMDFDNQLLNWIWSQLILLGTSQFAYIIGMCAYKYSNSKLLKSLFNKNDKKIVKTIAAVIIFIASFIFHMIVQSMFVAPFTAIAVLFSLYLIELPTVLKNILMFLGKNSTNIWLIHMFFYSRLFKNFVFVAKYPLAIVLLMFAVCIACSYVINYIYEKLYNFIIDRKLYKDKLRSTEV